jgi:hypothetical protein
MQAALILSSLSGHWTELAVGALVFVVSLVGSVLLAAYMLCHIPRDYLRSPDSNPFPIAEGRPPWQRTLARVGKNLGGAALIVLGVVLSLPGMPGQGVLTILVGLMLLDLPVMHRLERWLLARPSVLRGANKLRERRGCPPLDPMP